MDDIKYKINLVAAIAAIGAVLAFIGIVMSYTDFPGCVGILDLIIFALLIIVALGNLRPSIDRRAALLNIIVGILAIVITGLDYMHIADYAVAQSFMDVGIGIWMAFAGTIIYTIFTSSDFFFKKNQ